MFSKKEEQKILDSLQKITIVPEGEIYGAATIDKGPLPRPVAIGTSNEKVKSLEIKRAEVTKQLYRINAEAIVDMGLLDYYIELFDDMIEELKQ